MGDKTLHIRKTPLNRKMRILEYPKGMLERLDLDYYLLQIQIQKQIAKILDTITEILALRKPQLKELDNLIKSTFYHMFGDPGTNVKGWNGNL